MVNTKYHKLAQNRFLKGNERKNGGFENAQNEHFKSYHLNGKKIFSRNFCWIFPRK